MPKCFFFNVVWLCLFASRQLTAKSYELCAGVQMTALICIVALAADAPPLTVALNLAPS